MVSAQRESNPEASVRHLPLLRSECEESDRPCPYVSCKHHLYLDVSDAGSIKLNFPDVEPEEMQHSCVLDLADLGGLTLEQVSDTLNITRERVRQIEITALAKLEADGTLKRQLDDDYDGSSTILPSRT